MVQHIQPQDEIKLTLHLTILLDTMTRSTNADPSSSNLSEPTIHAMSKQLGEQYRDAQFTDFVIKCIDPTSKEEKEIKCHKFMLYSRSPVFRAMLQEHTLEYKTSQVKFEDIEFEVCLECHFSG